jgi:hypothetical protein
MPELGNRRGRRMRNVNLPRGPPVPVRRSDSADLLVMTLSPQLQRLRPPFLTFLIQLVFRRCSVLLLLLTRLRGTSSAPPHLPTAAWVAMVVDILSVILESSSAMPSQAFVAVPGPATLTKMEDGSTVMTGFTPEAKEKLLDLKRKASEVSLAGTPKDVKSFLSWRLLVIEKELLATKFERAALKEAYENGNIEKAEHDERRLKTFDKQEQLIDKGRMAAEDLECQIKRAEEEYILDTYQAFTLPSTAMAWLLTDPAQGVLGEVVFHRLSQSYVVNGGGFGSHRAGRAGRLALHTIHLLLNPLSTGARLRLRNTNRNTLRPLTILRIGATAHIPARHLNSPGRRSNELLYHSPSLPLPSLPSPGAQWPHLLLLVAVLTTPLLLRRPLRAQCSLLRPRRRRSG